MICHQCGKEIPADCNFCIYCGFPITSSSSPPTPPPLPEQNASLTPAESLIIFDETAKIGQLIKLTVMDLIVRKIVRIDEKEITRGILKRKTKVPFLSRGENFAKEELKPHEQVIVDCIKPSEFEIELDTFKRRIGNKMSSYVIDYLKSPLVTKGYFHVEEKKALKIFRYKKWTLTEKGKEAKRKIEEFVEQGKNNLPQWINSEPGKAATFLALAGRNLLLLSLYGYTIYDFKRWFDTLPTERVENDFYDCYTFPWHSEFTSLDVDSGNDFDFDNMDFDFDDLGSLDSDFDFDDLFDFDGGDFDGGDGGDFGGD